MHASVRKDSKLAVLLSQHRSLRLVLDGRAACCRGPARWQPWTSRWAARMC